MEAPRKCPCPAACVSLWRLPSLFGDDTHCGGCTAKVGIRARDTHRVVSNVGGLRAWPIDRCSDKDAGRSQRKPPTLLGNKQAKRKRTTVTKKPMNKGNRMWTSSNHDTIHVKTKHKVQDKKMIWDNVIEYNSALKIIESRT